MSHTIRNILDQVATTTIELGHWKGHGITHAQLQALRDSLSKLTPANSDGDLEEIARRSAGASSRAVQREIDDTLAALAFLRIRTAKATSSQARTDLNLEKGRLEGTLARLRKQAD
jgi:hypothetical protein